MVTIGERLVLVFGYMDTTVLSETTGSVKKAKTHNQFYFSSDKGLHRFSLKNFNRLFY